MTVKDMAQISIFAVLTAAGARLMVPVPVVPFTMQTLVCMLAGLVLGSRRGAASQALYMFMGLAGIPVFTGGGGLGAVFSPSFGYIVGFIACAWISGRLLEIRRKSGLGVSKGYCLAAALCGAAAVYAVGLVHLYVIMNFWMPGNGMSLFKVLSIGFLSTAGGDVIKAFIASAIAWRLERTGLFAN